MIFLHAFGIKEANNNNNNIRFEEINEKLLPQLITETNICKIS